MTSLARSVATLLVAPAGFDSAAAEVTGDAYRHLFRARRLAVGDRIRVVDGEGHAREGSIAEVERGRARVELGAGLPSRESPLSVALVVAMPRSERASWLVEKATEIGVRRIAWVSAERSAREPSSALLERHRRVAAAALEQCGRARLPEISGPHSWAEVPTLVNSFEHWWTLDPDGGTLRPPEGSVESLGEAPVKSVGLVIGPEGGWTEQERSDLGELGGRAWSLGDRVLRVETAAIVGSALLLATS